MSNMNISQFAMNMIQNNSDKIQNKELANQLMDILQTGNLRKGEELANGILQQNNIQKEDALKQARSFFRF